MSTTLEIPVQRTAAGLCATCEHAPACTHPRTPGAVVLACDDVSPLMIVIPAPTGVDAVLLPAPPQRAAAIGLCATCVRLSSCTYPRPEGGVWHCDEFDGGEA